MLGGVVLLILTVVAGMVLGLWRFAVIDTGSMRPTLNPGDVAVLTSEPIADLRTDRPRPAQAGQLERDPATQRVAGEVDLLEPQLVEQPLRVVDDMLQARRSHGGGPPATMPQHGWGDHVVVAGQQRCDVAPHPLAAQDPMQQHERLTRPLTQHPAIISSRQGSVVLFGACPGCRYRVDDVGAWKAARSRYTSSRARG